MVAVHGVVAPGQGRNGAAGLLQGPLQGWQIAADGAWRGVASVCDDVDLGAGPVPPAQVDQRHQMVDVAVHPAVRHQTHQVDRAPLGGRGLDGGDERRVLEKAAVGDGVVDQDQVLANGAAGAQGHVADLGVAHLPVG